MEGSSFEVKYADFVLVGGGLASATVVETLRAAGPSLPITPSGDRHPAADAQDATRVAPAAINTATS